MQFTCGLKAPGFNAWIYQLISWLQSLLFQMQLVPLHRGVSQRRHADGATTRAGGVRGGDAVRPHPRAVHPDQPRDGGDAREVQAVPLRALPAGVLQQPPVLAGGEVLINCYTYQVKPFCVSNRSAFQTQLVPLLPGGDVRRVPDGDGENLLSEVRGYLFSAE
jgi:hypothetical protein